MRLKEYAALLIAASVASAVPEYVPIQEKAQGQSLTGASLANDSVFSNPASSAFVNTYSLQGDFLFPRSFALSVIDTRTTSVAGGAAYYRRIIDGAARPLQGGRLGLSGRLSNMVGVGVMGKTVWGPTADLKGEDHMNDVDAGVLANFGIVQAGATLRNLLGGSRTMGYDREMAVGGRINYQGVMYFSASAIAKTSEVSPYQYGFGAEYVSPYYLSVKGGFRTQPYTAQSYWSFGASFLSPMMSLHYALEKATFGEGKIEHVFGCSMML